jgi:hypothetical protein
MFGHGFYFIASVWEMIRTLHYGRSWIGGGGGAPKIWFPINEVVHEGDFFPPKQLFVDASNSLREFRWVNTTKGNAQSLAQVEDPITWKKPPICMIKVNWDAAIDKTNGRIGIAIIVWEHERAILAACNTTKTLLVEAVVVEVLIVVHAVEFCREISFFFEIILEGNALQIVNVVKVRGYNWSEMVILSMKSKIV